MTTEAQIFNSQAYRRFSLAGCLLAGLIGTLVLIGWQFNITALKSIFPNYISMKANAAICFLLVAIALGLLRTSPVKSWHRILANTALVITFSIALATLCEYYFSINLGIDELVVMDVDGHSGKFPAGRLAPITGVMFVMISIGALMMDHKNQRFGRFAHFLFFISFICAFQAFVAYCYGVTYAFGSAFYTQMAVHTSVTASLLALAFLAARPNKGLMIVVTSNGIGGYMARRIIAMGILAPPIVNFLEIKGRNAGIFDSDFGVLARVISHVVIFVLIAWRMSKALHDSDVKRQKMDRINRDLADVVRNQQVANELNTAMENALDGVAKLDANGHFLTANKALVAMLNVDNKDLIGKDWFILAKDSDHHILQAMVVEMKARGRAEAEICGNQEGRYFHLVLVRMDSVGDSQGNSFLFANDISTRKRGEEALSASRAQLAEAQHIAQIGSWSVEAGSENITVSEEFYRIYGLDPASSTTTRSMFRAAMHPDDAAEATEKTKADSFRLDYRIFRPNGEMRYLHSRGQKIKSLNGGPDKIVGTIQDVTDLRLVEKELIAAREAALESSRLKSSFLANMSHEIRTPINGVIGMTGLLADSPLQPEQKEYVDAIARSANALLVIINDILDVSKIEAGKLDIETVPFDLDEIISDVGKLASLETKKKKLQFNVQNPRDIEHLLQGDAGRIRQVLMNLISNAIKFTTRGKVELRVEQIACNETDSIQIRFIIQDTGIGIEPHTLEKLFKPFTQADASTTRRFGGTGLGLSISKQLVELMGGKIGASSTQGKGSTFWFTLPFKLGDARKVVASPQELGKLPNFGGARVLIAEDNFINQKVAYGILEKLGCKPHCVGNGLEALSALSDLPFDLVLMDCQMPELDGFEATARIRSSKTAWSKIPIIAMTANVVKGDRERCLEAGMNDYISKPVKITELAKLIEHWFKASGSSVGTASYSHHREEATSLPTLDTQIIDEIRQFSDSSNDAVIIDLFESFLTTTPKILSHLEESCNTGQIKKLKFEAHSLKSSSGALGATRFSSLCQQLELTTESMTQEDISALINHAKDEFQKVEKQMRDFLAKPLVA